MNAFDETSIQAMKRPALQRLAKENGVRAVGPDAQIRKALLEWLAGNASTSLSTVPTAAEGETGGVLHETKNLVEEEGSQAERTGTRRSARLTVAKATPNPPSKAVLLNGKGPDTGDRPERTVLGPLGQGVGSEELIGEFEAALTLLRLGEGKLLGAKSSRAANSGQKRKRTAVVDGAEPPRTLRPSQPKRRRTRA